MRGFGPYVNQHTREGSRCRSFAVRELRQDQQHGQERSGERVQRRPEQDGEDSEQPQTLRHGRAHDRQREERLRRQALEQELERLSLHRPRAGEELMVAAIVVAPDQSLVVHCDDRKMTLSWKDLQDHAGARGQRGAVLSRNYRKVTRLTVE